MLPDWWHRNAAELFRGGVPFEPDEPSYITQRRCRMDDRKPNPVDDSETTYRVQSNRIADLKARALAAYFAPDVVEFRPQNVKNNRALALAYIDARAVMDRLDEVLGPDNWSDTYTDLDGGSVRCVLAVRFESGGDWVTKSDVGAPSEQPDRGDQLKAAHSDALKRAAIKFGVGRYLYSLPKMWADYDPVKKQFTNAQLPPNCVPVAYRPCGPDKGRKISGLLESALTGAKIDRSEWRRAWRNLVGDYGYAVEVKPVDIHHRHADAIVQRCNQWIAEIARNNPNCPFSPLYTPPPPDGKAEQKTEEKPAAETKKEDKKPAKPANGAELIARLEVKDKELAEAGRMQRGALKTHVISQGAKHTYSVDVTRWTGTAIDNAMKWAKEFIDGLPGPGTVAQSEEDAPPLAVA